MSGYIGTQPVPQATQTRDAFTATNNQTSFPTSGYTPEFLDVFLNGVKLAASDYTATNGSDVVLAVGATTGDILEVVSYGTFEVLNPTFDGNVTFTGNASFGDNDKAIFGDGNDLQIYSDGTHSRIYESGSGLLVVRASNFNVNNADGSDSYITMQDGGAVTSYYDGSAKLATTSTGVDVTGTVTSDGLTVQSNNNLDIHDADNHVSGRLRNVSGGNNALTIEADPNNSASGSFISLKIDTSEKMRIDSSGNLLVGTTDSNVANNSGSGNDGVSIQPDSVRIARTDGDMLLLNRLNSDGDIAKFLKDGTTVGSIKARYDYTTLQIGSTGTGITGTSSHKILPSVNNARSDNTNDLGDSSYRWKDLYISGAVYLGGVGSANKLDDYEDGSFNVTLATDTASTAPSFAGTGYYIKVGNMVHLHGQVTISGSSSGGINLHIPLPFVPVNMRGALTVGLNQALSMKPSGEYLGIIVELNVAKAYIVSTAFGGGHSHLGFNECGTGLFSFSGSYRTA